LGEPTIAELVETHAVDGGTTKSAIYKGLGLMFAGLALAGVFIPGWPTVSWAVPAAFFFSLSSKRLFRWTLSNRFFGGAMYKYYATGKTIPRHAKIGICTMIALSAAISAFGVFKVSYPADPGYGPTTIAIAGLIGIWYVARVVKTRAQTDSCLVE